MDELGSGVRNTVCGIYTIGTKPEFIENDVFRTIIPLEAKRGTTRKTTQKRILDLLREFPSSSRKELAAILGDITEDG